MANTRVRERLQELQAALAEAKARADRRRQDAERAYRNALSACQDAEQARERSVRLMAANDERRGRNSSRPCRGAAAGMKGTRSAASGAGRRTPDKRA
ncbi:hypothetical protein [Nonomuraea sp. NPDC050783]|uniref:hypothetical protein n=1 Tax=Nonomuraea sp. NPDC050783 TaxID=3154634 RepID=UPI003467D0BE